MDKPISEFRENYVKNTLSKEDLTPEPTALFLGWFAEYAKLGRPDTNAMSLATVDEKGHPDVRIVLLKGVEGDHFVFYTNYHSRKGRQLDAHPHAALAFFFAEHERQVRIRGSVERVSAKDSTTYFNSRPRESRIGAHTSPQSHVVATREELEKRYLDLEKQFEGKSVPRPENWGGYAIIPTEIEFWQGRENRLHDRFLYTKQANGEWKVVRLAP